MKTSKLFVALFVAMSLGTFSACSGGGGGGESGGASTAPGSGGDGGDGSGGGGGGGGSPGTTRTYVLHHEAYPQETAQYGPYHSRPTLTVDSLTGAVNVSGVLSTGFMPGSNGLGYIPLDASGWYLYEAPGALAVLVKKEMNGMEPITDLYVGLPSAGLQCPSAPKNYGASYGLRSLYTGTSTNFGSSNAGFRFEVNTDFLNAVSYVRNLIMGGASPNFTLTGGTVQHEIDVHQMFGCETAGCNNGYLTVQCNSPMMNIVSSVNSSAMVGRFYDEKKALFVANSAAVGTVASYAGTYDGFVVNHPNGFSHRIGVVIDASGTIHTSLNTSSDNTLEAFSGSGQTQLIVRTGAPENGKFLVTPIRSGDGVVLWGTFETNSIAGANDTFFVLNKRP